MSKIEFPHSKNMADTGKYDHYDFGLRVRDWYRKVDIASWENFKTPAEYEAMKKMGGKYSHENIVKTSIAKFFNFTTAPVDVVYSWKESPGHDEG